MGRTLGWRWAGFLVGGAAAYLAIQGGTLGRGELIAAPIFGVCALLGTLVGELTAPVPSGAIRRAQLRVRRVRDYISPSLGVIVAIAAGVLAILATATTAVASADDMGRAGRSLSCVTGEGTMTAGPWPGSFYTVPGLALVLLGLMLAALTLRRIVRRPQPAETAPADDDLRRRSTELVTAAAGVLVLVPLFGIALTAGGALRTMAGGCGHAWWAAAGWGLVGLAAAAAILVIWCAALLLRPQVHA